MSKKKEKWKWIPGYKGYYKASDQGRVRSVSRPVVDKNGMDKLLKGRMLKASPSSKTDRRMVGLSKNGKVKSFYVHQIVLRTFVGKCPLKMECCHNNGNASDDRLKNLRYATHKSNIEDRELHGTVPRGEDNVSSKLTLKEINKIRKTYFGDPSATSYAKLAKKFHTNPAAIGCIVNYDRWKVDEEGNALSPQKLKLLQRSESRLRSKTKK